MQHMDKKTAYDSVAAGLESSRSKLEMVFCFPHDSIVSFYFSNVKSGIGHLL